MSSGLIRFPGRSAVFAPQYFGSVAYYALSSAYGQVYIDGGMKADKRFKSAHRCRIVDTRDEIMLTMPVCHPHGTHSWQQTIVSTHGKWWSNHLTALESAYGRTPFFEFYIDKFSRIFDGNAYEDGRMTVGETDRLCDSIIREILHSENKIIYTGETPATADADDFRLVTDFATADTEYYQIRADRLGFRAGLSVLDLIFNMGPEAPLVLASMVRS